MHTIYIVFYFTTLYYSTILYYTILYYTILYYTILYYTILYYTILYYTILYYTILYYAILCYTILYCTILYYTILYYTILYYTILCYTMLYFTILYHTIQYYTILYYTKLYYTILYYTILYYIHCGLLQHFAVPSKKKLKVNAQKGNKPVNKPKQKQEFKETSVQEQKAQEKERAATAKEIAVTDAKPYLQMAAAAWDVGATCTSGKHFPACAIAYISNILWANARTHIEAVDGNFSKIVMTHWVDKLKSVVECADFQSTDQRKQYHEDMYNKSWLKLKPQDEWISEDDFQDDKEKLVSNRFWYILYWLAMKQLLGGMMGIRIQLGDNREKLCASNLQTFLTGAGLEVDAWKEDDVMAREFKQEFEKFLKMHKEKQVWRERDDINDCKICNCEVASPCERCSSCTRCQQAMFCPTHRAMFPSRVVEILRDRTPAKGFPCSAQHCTWPRVVNGKRSLPRYTVFNYTPEEISACKRCKMEYVSKQIVADVTAMVEALEDSYAYLSQQRPTLLGKLLVYEQLQQQWDILTEFAFPQKGGMGHRFYLEDVLRLFRSSEDNGRAYLEEDMVSFLVLSHPDANRHVIGFSLIRIASPIVFPSENYTVRGVVKDYMRRWDKSQGRRPGWHFLFLPSHINVDHFVMRLVFLWQHNAPDGLTALACFSLDPYDGLRVVKSEFYDTVKQFLTERTTTQQNTVQDLKLGQLSLDQLIPQDVRQKNSIDCGLFVVHAIAAMCSSMRVFAAECQRKYSTMAVMLSPEGEQELLNKTLVTEMNTFLTSGASSVEKEWRRYTGSPGSMRVQAQAWLGEMLTATQETHKVIFEELQKLPAEYRETTVVTHWLPHKIVDLGKCKSELNPMPREWCPYRTSQGAQVQCCPGCENLVITKDAEKGKRMHKRVVLFLRSQNSYRLRQAKYTRSPFQGHATECEKVLVSTRVECENYWGWCRRRPWFVQHPGHAVREDRQKVRILAPGIEAGGSLQKLIDNQQKQLNVTVRVPLDAATDEGDSQQGQKPGLPVSCIPLYNKT
eukprot:g36180.t1